LSCSVRKGISNLEPAERTKSELYGDLVAVINSGAVDLLDSRSSSAWRGTPHWRRGHLAWLQAAARTSAAERERCAVIVKRWNAAPTHDWSPAIGTALKAGYRWLDVYCGGCRQVKPIDLAAVDIHPQAGLTSLILMLRCRQCGGNGPLPKLIGLSRFPPDAAAAWK
jgi:hypothetical protein